MDRMIVLGESSCLNTMYKQNSWTGREFPERRQMLPSISTFISFSLGQLQKLVNTGIKHDFPFINIRYVPRGVLQTGGVLYWCTIFYSHV